MIEPMTARYECGPRAIFEPMWGDGGSREAINPPMSILPRRDASHRGAHIPHSSNAGPPSASRPHEFVAFLDQIVSSEPPDREIHIIADNLSAHKTAKVLAFLKAHPNVQLHYTPHLRLVAQPGGSLVRHAETRSPDPRDLHVGHRSRAQAAAVHHEVQRTRDTRALGVCRSQAAHCITLEMTDTVH